jgi:hypothetical protein
MVESEEKHGRASETRGLDLPIVAYLHLVASDGLVPWGGAAVEQNRPTGALIRVCRAKVHVAQDSVRKGISTMDAIYRGIMVG